MIYVDCESDATHYIIWSDVKGDLFTWGVSYGYRVEDINSIGYIKLYKSKIIDEFIRLKCDVEHTLIRKVRNKIVGYYVINRCKNGSSSGKSVLLQDVNAVGEHIKKLSYLFEDHVFEIEVVRE